MRIKNLNIEIKRHFYSKKRINIRRKILPGNTKSLWNAVNAAHDNGCESIPDCMKLNGRLVGGHERAECFADYILNKVKQVTESTVVDPTVYNGTRKIDASSGMFMSMNDVEGCIKSIKIIKLVKGLVKGQEPNVCMRQQAPYHRSFL